MGELKLSPCANPAANEKMFTRPPRKYSKEQIKGWIDEEAAATKPSLPVQVMEAEEWADYINHHHFVPLTLEGVPADFKFDYDWVEEEDPRRPLPTAEVTESGAFLFWWDRCNYYELTEQRCRDFIKLAVRHEIYHSDQWQRIAVSVLTALGYDVDPKRLPSKLTDLGAYGGATMAFMRIWADGAHYQCREVEVYTTQMENGDMSKETTGDFEFRRRLQNLHVYAYGDENSPGCANSKWALEFSAYLKRADRLFEANNIKSKK